MAIFQRLDDAHWQAHSFGQLGFLALYRCAYAKCVQHCDHAIARLTQLNRTHETVHWLFHAAAACLCQDNDNQALHYLTRCRQVAQQFADSVWDTLCTFLTSCRLLGKGHYTAALTTFERVESELGNRIRRVMYGQWWLMAIGSLAISARRAKLLCVHYTQQRPTVRYAHWRWHYRRRPCWF